MNIGKEVKNVKEVKIFKEVKGVIACDVSPVAMFPLIGNLKEPVGDFQSCFNSCRYAQNNAD